MIENYAPGFIRAKGEPDRLIPKGSEAGYLAMLEAEPIATVLVPIRTVSEANSHEHWRYRQKRAKAQHEAVLLTWLCNRKAQVALFRWGKMIGPTHVHLTRLASRKLDSDNLAGSQKHVRDAVAKFLGVDDGREDLVSWSYGQERAKGYSVRIEFYRRTA